LYFGDLNFLGYDAKSFGEWFETFPKKRMSSFSRDKQSKQCLWFAAKPHYAVRKMEEVCFLRAVEGYIMT
jgi:hypothetical protein